MRRRTHWLPSVAALLLTTSHTHAESKPPPIRERAQWIGTFFDVAWNQDATTSVDGTKQGSKDTNFGGDATYGYCLTPHWALALSVGGLFNTKIAFMQDVDGMNIAPKTTERSFVVAPTVRYYMRAREDTFFFLQGRASIVRGAIEEQRYVPTTNTITTLEYDQLGFSVRFSPGLAVFLTDHLAAEALIGEAGFGVTRANDGNGNRRKRDDVQAVIFANSINIGFAYYFMP